MIKFTKKEQAILERMNRKLDLVLKIQAKVGRKVDQSTRDLRNRHILKRR